VKKPRTRTKRKRGSKLVPILIVALLLAVGVPTLYVWLGMPQPFPTGGERALAQQNVNTNSSVLSIRLTTAITIFYANGSQDFISAPEIPFLPTFDPLAVMRQNKTISYVNMKFYAVVDPEKEPLICSSKVSANITITDFDTRQVIWSTSDSVKRTYVLFSTDKYPIYEYNVTAAELEQRINYQSGTYILGISAVFYVANDNTVYKASTTESLTFERPHGSVSVPATSGPATTAAAASASSSDAWTAATYAQAASDQDAADALHTAQYITELETIKNGVSTAMGYTTTTDPIGQQVILDPAGNMHCYGYVERNGEKIYPYTVDSQGHLVANPAYFGG